MAISKQQSMRPAEIELIDASNQHESTLQEHTQSLETLDENLSTETTDRETADTALGTRIDDEAQARTDADTALGTRIDNEVQARTSSDANLQGQIDALVAIGAEPNVIDSISVNGVAQTVTGKNVDITASSVVDGNSIAPSSVAATGNVSGSSVSDSVGSLDDLRDAVDALSETDDIFTVTANSGYTVAKGSVKRFGHFAFIDLGLTSTSAINAFANTINPCRISNASYGVVSSDCFVGQVSGNGDVWLSAAKNIAANTKHYFTALIFTE